MLGELYWYVHQEPPPADANTTEETLKYLKACHHLFECGFLAHDKVASLDSPVFNYIDQGFQYFTTWLTTLLTEGSYNVQFTVIDCQNQNLIDPSFQHTSSTQKAFLSWQSECIVCSIYMYSLLFIF